MFCIKKFKIEKDSKVSLQLEIDLAGRRIRSHDPNLRIGLENLLRQHRLLGQFVSTFFSKKSFTDLYLSISLLRAN